MKAIKVAFAYYEEIYVPDNASDAEIDEIVSTEADVRQADVFGWSDNPSDEFMVV